MSDVIVMITGRQIRAARALLHCTQEMLAEKSLVALTALKRLESERGLGVHEGTRDQVRRALEAANRVHRFAPRPRRHGAQQAASGSRVACFTFARLSVALTVSAHSETTKCQSRTPNRRLLTVPRQVQS